MCRSGRHPHADRRLSGVTHSLYSQCHLAHTSDLVQYFDFDSPLFMEEDPITGGMQYHPDWEITLPDSPGLGITVAEEWLNKFRKVTIQG